MTGAAIGRGRLRGRVGRRPERPRRRPRTARGVERRLGVEDREVEVLREVDVDRRGDPPAPRAGARRPARAWPLRPGPWSAGADRPLGDARVGAAQAAVQRPHVGAVADHAQMTSRRVPTGVR